MGLKTIVKVGGITNLSDARYCAGMGVELLGFTIDPENSNHVTPESFKEITGWISGVELVVETGIVHMETIEDYNYSYIQVNNPRLLSAVKGLGSKAILEMNVNDYSIEQLISLGKSTSDIVAYYLFENIPDDRHVSLETINLFAKAYPVLVGFNVNLRALDNILASPAKGIAMHGSVEDKPGYKSFDELADVLEYLEEE